MFFECRLAIAEDRKIILFSCIIANCIFVDYFDAICGIIIYKIEVSG